MLQARLEQPLQAPANHSMANYDVVAQFVYNLSVEKIACFLVGGRGGQCASICNGAFRNASSQKAEDHLPLGDHSRRAAARCHYISILF
jgi:hypothetical protein